MSVRVAADARPICAECAHAAAPCSRCWVAPRSTAVICDRVRGEGSLLASRPRGRLSLRGRHAVRAVKPCIQRVGHAERSSLSLEQNLPARHGTVCKAGLVHGESSGRTVHMCEAHYAASSAGMRTALPVKWKHHVVHVHLYAHSANDCAASRVGVAAVRGNQKHGARSSPRRPRDRDRQRSQM